MTTADRAAPRQAVPSRNIRRQVPKAVIRELKERRDLPGLLFLAAHLAALAGGGWLIHLALGTWWIVPATVFQGILIVCLFAPFHEASHHSAFRSDWLNNATLWLTGLLLLNHPTRFMYAHVNHHAYTQDLTLDPQNLARAEKLKSWLLYATGFDILAFYLRMQVLFLSPRTVPAGTSVYLPREKVMRTVWECRAFWLVYLAVAAAAVSLQSWAPVIYWLLPRFACEWFQSTIRLSEHVGCGYRGDIENRTRTVLTLPPVRWLCWNMSYHLEHHAFPNVPFHRLPALHRHLRGGHVHVGRGHLRTAAGQLTTAVRGKAAAPPETAA